MSDGEGKIPLSEAVELMTIGEVGLLQRHFKKNYEDLGAVEQLAGTIWAMERRAPVEKGGKRFDWADVEAMTMRMSTDYFAPEPVEVDDDDPETDSGKDDSPDD